MKRGRPGQPPTTQLCAGCGKPFTAHMHKGKRRRFCTHACYGKWLSWIHSDEFRRQCEEREAEERSWQGFSDQERALYG